MTTAQPAPTTAHHEAELNDSLSYLSRAVGELQRRFKVLSTENAMLRDENKRLKARLEDMACQQS
jgi:regulator of replication initiation timing